MPLITLEGGSIIFIFIKRKLRHREGKPLAEGHTARKWESDIVVFWSPCS
jgi:hypothetical protein